MQQEYVVGNGVDEDSSNSSDLGEELDAIRTPGATTATAVATGSTSRSTLEERTNDEEEDILYNIPSSSSSSYDSGEDIQDEFIFRLFEKEEKKRLRQVERLSNEEEEGSTDSDDEYYERDSPLYHSYGSFQKDLAANARRFAEEIHRKKKKKEPQSW